MDICKIIPYERNARKNEKAIPAVAASMREFGLRGQIVLQSRDNPVIVTGHTRVAACKLLGWTEIPDENIAYCDGLTEEQIKAYRLADNRTGEIATWNKALLKSEIKSLEKSGLDMSRFKFEFKSKMLPYGAERLKTDDAYNLRLVNASYCAGHYGMPVLVGIDHVPQELLGFNYAKTTDKFNACIHFFIDDYQFERLWNSPEQYLELLQQFDSVLTPDFSCYMDMPLPMQQWNEYRRRALGNWWQRNGIRVIPTLSWSDKRSYGFAFNGLPKHSTVAVSTVGVKKDVDAIQIWNEGMKAAIQRLRPSCILLYGGNIGFDFGNIRVVEYKANTAFENR